MSSIFGFAFTSAMCPQHAAGPVVAPPNKALQTDKGKLSCLLHSQKAQVEAEISEISTVAPDGAVAERSSVRQRYFQAEDLALRAIQNEYHSPLARQVSFGSGVRVDGAFTIDGGLHIVEIKYVPSGSLSVFARRALDQVASYIQRSGWQRVSVILALVIEESGVGGLEPTEISELEQRIGVPTRILIYDLAELRRRFGAESDGA